MKTILKIENDYNSNLSFDYWKEIFSETDFKFYIESVNKSFYLPIENEHEKQQFKNCKIIEAKGYSQSDWQTYKIYFNGELPEYIETALKRTFTHKNDYTVSKYEQAEINGKIFNAEPHDYTIFCIEHIEFPNENDIINEYNNIFGKDYDKYIIDNK